MKFRKPGKGLEKTARQVLDSDDFVTHIAGVTHLYRRELQLDEAPQRRELSRSLHSFQRHATALAEWLQQADKERQPERAALQLLAKNTLSTTDAPVVRQWLTQGAALATGTIAGLKGTKPDPGRVLRVAAEALKATFEHHRLKWSLTISKGEPSPALAVLCAIARDAGDKVWTPAAVRAALRATDRK